MNGLLAPTSSQLSLQASLLRLCLVHAIEDGMHEPVTSFFQKHGERLGSCSEAAGWEPWFAVPFLQKPQKDPRFQVPFPTSPPRQRKFFGPTLSLPMPQICNHLMPPRPPITPPPLPTHLLRYPWQRCTDVVDDEDSTVSLLSSA